MSARVFALLGIASIEAGPEVPRQKQRTPKVAFSTMPSPRVVSQQLAARLKFGHGWNWWQVELATLSICLRSSKLGQFAKFGSLLCFKYTGSILRNFETDLPVFPPS